jgi:hypothetical protein
VAGSLAPALVAGRGAPAETRPLRFGLPGPTAPEAGGLLALDLLGRIATPVFLPHGMTPEAAVAAGVADAVVLTGADAVARAAALGLMPWFSFDADGAARDPALPEVTAFGEMLSDPPRPELVAALRSAGAALRARGLLVLPALTSADAVALWRDAGRRWAEEAATATGMGTERGTRRVGGDEAAWAMATLCPLPEAQLAYRDWLRRRLNWQAG